MIVYETRPLNRAFLPPPEVAPPPRPVTGKPATPADPPKETETAKEKEAEPKTPPVPERDQHYFAYAAALDGLPFNAAVTYRVKLAGKVVREATVRTRATADKSVRIFLGDRNGKFVVHGDVRPA